MASETENAAPEEEEEIQIEPSFSSDIIELEHTFGYDCKRLNNLCLVDDDTLVFASGNFIHYFSISRREITFRRTVFDSGIGFITKNEHPDYLGLFTVAENGPTPTIFIYKFPSHEVLIALEGAAKQQFTCGSYNSSGELFASQAGYPDFMLTIWRWKQAEVVLRSKSFQNDVLHVHFSFYNPILLVSCGLSHIKFWKMAHTFTGLKLQGDLGRFGKTDFSDIYAIYMLPDENVLSGCEWGNILLWEAGLIKFEVCRKDRKPCHAKPITRITMDNGEVTTVGMDGYVRIWFWETVDLADPPDDDRFVEIEPIYEFKIGKCEIRAVQKINPFNPTDFGYYAQDGNGGIWFCDLNVNDIPKDSYKLYSCHGGRVIAAQTSPAWTYLITLGEDGKLLIFDYGAKKLLLEKQLNILATDLLWLPTQVSPSGMEIVAGFEDGVLRHFAIDLKNSMLHLVRAVKSHISVITKLTINPTNTILVSGSTDRSIFLYGLTEIQNNLVHLTSLGFIKLDGIPNCFNWMEDKEATILVGGQAGEVYQYNLPTKVTEEQNFLSYNLTRSADLKSTKFVSVKSKIRRLLFRGQVKKRKALKRQRKLDEVEKLKKANPGLQIDLESALADSEPEEEDPPLYCPPKPSPVLWLQYTTNNTIWVSMGGYDAGYIYELTFDAPEPVRSTMIADGDDCEIHSYLNIEDFSIFGLVTGKIRINHTIPVDFTDLRDYRLFSLHDTLRGRIPRLVLNHDGTRLCSIGYDGNIFVFVWSGPIAAAPEKPKDIPTKRLSKIPDGVEDIDDPEYPSLEQEKIYAELKRQEEAAAAHDRQVLGLIGELQVKFNDFQRRNSTLPEELQIQHCDMLLDPRITNQISDELQAELDDVREDLAYDLEVAQVGKMKLYKHFLKELDHIPINICGIGKDVTVYSFRLNKLGEIYEQMKLDIEERLRLEAMKVAPVGLLLAEVKSDIQRGPGEEMFFFGREPNNITPRFSIKMLRLLKRYRNRQLYESDRVYYWEKLAKRRPDPNKNHPDDDENIRLAERNLGDYKLKTSADYEPKANENFTHKYIQIANCYEQYHTILSRFNRQLFELRRKKKDLYDFIAMKRTRLDVLHKLLPVKNREHFPDIPDINLGEEYAELNLIEKNKPSCHIEISNILHLGHTVAELLPTKKELSRPSTAENTLRHSHEYQMYRSLRVEDVEYLPSDLDLKTLLDDLPSRTDPAYYLRDSHRSPWLLATRYLWILHLLDEQQVILYTVKERIDKFNAELHKLHLDRIQVKFEAEFMQAYMIALNQELYILRDSEQIENHLLGNADEAMKTRNQMQTIINASNRLIDDGRKACDRLNDLITQKQYQFLSTCKTHKFFDFLRRIFKKKWKPPKAEKDGDESSESSSDDESSSEEDADNKSVDSSDMTTIRLDETHCPAGLERSTYEWAFKIRAERHDLERGLSEQQKVIETRRLEVAELMKQMKYHEDVYDREKNTLLEFRRKRQQELNKVNVAAILRMGQLQHFYEGDDYRNIERAVLFDANLLIKLKSRVDQLKSETLETKKSHRLNITHLRRMNADIGFMKREIIRLEGEIKAAMMKKFGIVVNMDELEEEILKKYVFDLETTIEDELVLIDKEIEKRKKELAGYEIELLRETQENAKKLNTLAVLQEEKNFLDEILLQQELHYDSWFKAPALDLDTDLEKLTAIDKQQKEQIKCLEREICTLRMKSKPLQLDSERSKIARGMEPDIVVTTAVIPSDEVLGPCIGDFLTSDAIPFRVQPDEFIMDRVHKIVQRMLVANLAAHANNDQIRKFAFKLTRYLGQAAYSFQGEVTDRILACILERLQELMPKKYLIYISGDELRKVFHEILAVFDYERSEVNTEDLISGIFGNAMESLGKAPPTLNKTQFIVEKMFKELIEVLPLDEFQSENTLRSLIEILGKEAIIQPKCLSIEKLIENVVKYAQENLLDDITAIPIRRLVEAVTKELRGEEQGGGTHLCSISSAASITISRKK